MVFLKLNFCALRLGRRLASQRRRLPATWRHLTKRSFEDPSIQGDRSKRLVEDVRVEYNQQMEHMIKISSIIRMEEKWRREAAERAHLPPEDQFTTLETKVLEDAYGMQNVDRWMEMIQSKGKCSDKELLGWKVCMLHTAQRRIEFLDAIDHSLRDEAKLVLVKMADDYFENLPSVMIDHGHFPANEEIIKRYQTFKDLLPSSGPMNTIVQHLVSSITIRSPSGPISSSSCYEELSTYHSSSLQNLLDKGCGLVTPRSKIFLTVVREAVVSPNLVVTMVVRDECDQYVILQIFNMKDIKPRIEGLECFPVGGHFFLKDPFLKVGNDGWPLLRVDQPFDLQRLDVPPLHGAILVLGDGDFSFSVALARENSDQGNATITATSLDSQNRIERKYSKGKENLAMLAATPGVTVHHGVDAISIDRHAKLEKYDSIVWNFPYPPDKGAWSCNAGGKVVFDFLASARECLRSSGRIFLALASQQGGTTREASSPRLKWDMEEQAHKAGLEVVEVLPLDLVRGYEPKRAFEDATFPSKNARVHIFKVKEVSFPGEEPSPRFPESIVASLAMDTAFGRLGHEHHFKEPSAAMQRLEPDCSRSIIARQLFQAAQLFEEVLGLLSEMEKNIDVTSIEDLILIATPVVDCLDKIFQTRHGDLVVLWNSSPTIQLAHRCSSLSLIKFVGKFTAVGDGLLSAESSLVFLSSLESHFRTLDVPTPSEGNQLFTKALRVYAHMCIYCDRDPDVLMPILDITCRMMPLDASIHNLRANVMNLNIAEQEYADDSTTLGVVSDCAKAMELVQLDETNHHYQGALLSMSNVYKWNVKDSTRAAALFNNYAEIVAPDDRYLPSAHYQAGLLYLNDAACSKNEIPKAIFRKARQHYIAGLEAEKTRIAFFGSCETPAKRLLSAVMMEKEDEMNFHEMESDIKRDCAEPLNQAKTRPKCQKKNPDKKDSMELQIAKRIKALLVEHAGEMHACRVKELYNKTYGDSLPGKLKSLQTFGLFVLEYRKNRTALWLTLSKSKHDTKSDTKRSIGKSTNQTETKPKQHKGKPDKKADTEKEIAERIKALLIEHAREIYAGHAKELYKEKHGDPLPGKLKSLQVFGLFVLEYRKNRSALWITLPKSKRNKD